MRYGEGDDMARKWRESNELGGLSPTVRADDIPTTPAEVAAQIQVTAEVTTEVTAEVDDVAFSPTREQRKIRAVFYAAAKSKQVDLKAGITFDLVNELVPGCRQLRAWWHNDLFTEWFLNTNTYQTRIDYLIDLQLDNLEEVITNREGLYTTRDQVAAGRQLAEYKKAFIDEDKARANPDAGTDMIKAIAERMMAAKRLQAAKVTDVDAVEMDNDGRRVELP